MRATEHAPRGPCRLLERRHALAEVVERGGGVPVNRLRVNTPRPEREVITLAKSASRHRHCFAHQCLGFFEALEINKGKSVVVGFSKRVKMFFPFELQPSEVYLSSQAHGLFNPSKRFIRERKIALHDKQVVFRQGVELLRGPRREAEESHGPGQGVDCRDAADFSS